MDYTQVLAPNGGSCTQANCSCTAYKQYYPQGFMGKIEKSNIIHCVKCNHPNSVHLVTQQIDSTQKPQ
jgi:hypothetical protein